jgi:hypothetical protein
MPRRIEPQYFYLNEQHELSRVDREGGGSLPKLGKIDWPGKELRLSRSLTRTKRAISESSDPLRTRRYFLLARPEKTVPKLSSDKKKAPTGHFDESVDYAGKDSRILGRLGLDVLSVTDEGAIVHATPESFERLASHAPNLSGLGRAEQARWAFVSDFDLVPGRLRADEEWLRTVRSAGGHETIVELQPLLTRSEGSLVLTAIAEQLRRQDDEAILGSGTDFSGRSWLRAKLATRTIARIVKDFFSVQALHGPLLSAAMATGRRAASTGREPRQEASQEFDLPIVAVVDTGVAHNHPRLEPFRRGTFVHPQSQGALGSHGTFVTSRVVFGDQPDPINAPPIAECRFVDVVVAKGPKSIDDKIVVNSIEIVSANFPDARAFNLSFGDYVAFNLRPIVERTQRLFLTQDLDNLIFARDLLVVVAAGNSEPGLLPTPTYPEHWQDPSWGLGHWAVGFNTIKCGSFVREWSLLDGIADVPFAPSPFGKAGPGLADAPAPDFSAHGGNSAANYQQAPGLGVWGLTPAGLWEDRCGSSFAAPMLSRLCAFALQILQQVCPAGSYPFATTVKALLSLISTRPTLPARLEAAAERTLGFGEPERARLTSADSNSALFVWQGVLSHKGDIARVFIVIPKAWLEEAGDPVCDVAVAWDTPVNGAVPNVYGCRRVDFKLKPSPDADAMRGSRGAPGSYPLRVRTYALKKILEAKLVLDDLWIAELSYEETCDYPPTQTFSPEQRVSFALRLRDRDELASPQTAVQSSPVAATMTRLSAATIPVQTPVILKAPA